MTPREPLQWVLRPVGVPGMPLVFDVTADGITLGRDPGCTVVLPAAQFPQVSTHHARVALVDGGLVVTDLGSTNGTFVNGRSVTEERLASGDVLSLGEEGPRFAAMPVSSLDDTLNVAPVRRRPTLGSLGNSTIMNLRRVLQAAGSADVEQSVQRSSRRTVAVAVALSAVVLIAAIIGIGIVGKRGRSETDALRQMNQELRDEVAGARAEMQAQRQRLDEQRDSVVAERDRLAARIAAIESADSGDAAQLASDLVRLREQLDVANAKLELFDPVSLERERLREVAAVHRAVVLIEAVSHFRDRETGRRLHATIGPGGEELVNLDFEGRQVEHESSGTGFCISADGHILTNAHVVMPVERRSELVGPDGRRFDVETDLMVVFTGDYRRHHARVVAITEDADEDLAVIQIRPTPDMPIVARFSLETPAPEAGTEVYLHGFPLGKLLIQDGNRVVASTFKGILSRRVGGYLQVDASVHQGNSGGPVTDGGGNVIGVVSRVQGTPSGQFANSIGYVIPIERARLVWPPKDGE